MSLFKALRSSELFLLLGNGLLFVTFASLGDSCKFSRGTFYVSSALLSAAGASGNDA